MSAFLAVTRARTGARAVGGGLAGLALAGLAVAGLVPGAPPAVASPAPGAITTVAGGVGGPGPAVSIALSQPCAVTYAGGSIYFTDDSAADNFAPFGDEFIDEVIRGVSESTGT